MHHLAQLALIQHSPMVKVELFSSNAEMIGAEHNFFVVMTVDIVIILLIRLHSIILFMRITVKMIKISTNSLDLVLMTHTSPKLHRFVENSISFIKQFV